MSTQTIHLLRHGKTEANEQKLYCGCTDLPLSAEGCSALAQLKESAPYPEFGRLVHSGLARTKETMALLTGQAEGTHVPDLREMDFGEFEMKSYNILKSDSRYIDWITDKRPAPPGGESREVFQKRVLAGYQTLLSLCPKDGYLTAFVHGGVIAVLMEALFTGTRNFYEWQPAFGRGYTLTLQEGVPIQYTEI